MAFIPISGVSRKTDSRSVIIHCPVCNDVGVSATAKDLSEKLLLFHLIPIFVSNPTLVSCTCGAALISSRKARELAEMEPALTGQYLARRNSSLLVALVLGGIFAWIFPIAGLLWTGFAFLCVRKRRDWMRTLTIILLVLSLLPTAAFLISRRSQQPVTNERPTRAGRSAH